jgi:hypothetical protein
MRAPPATVYINKIAAAGRQLDAAIRMFFAREDELAIHTVASAASQVLRNLIQKRGKNLTAQVLQNGIYDMAPQYAEGKVPKELLRAIENSPLMSIIKYIIEYERAHGKKFDPRDIGLRLNKGDEQRAWPTKAANFLKHADRDPQDHLALDELKNEHILIGACAAYLEIMSSPTPEITAFVAFWAAKNDTDIGGEAEELLVKLRPVGEAARYGLCSEYIRHAQPVLPQSCPQS